MKKIPVSQSLVIFHTWRLSTRLEWMINFTVGLWLEELVLEATSKINWGSHIGGIHNSVSLQMVASVCLKTWQS